MIRSIATKSSASNVIRLAMLLMNAKRKMLPNVRFVAKLVIHPYHASKSGQIIKKSTVGMATKISTTNLRGVLSAEKPVTSNAQGKIKARSLI